MYAIISAQKVRNQSAQGTQIWRTDSFERSHEQLGLKKTFFQIFDEFLLLYCSTHNRKSFNLSVLLQREVTYYVYHTAILAVSDVTIRF